MIRSSKFLVVMVAAAIGMGKAASGAEVTGPAQIHDGDTLAVAGQAIRLEGIDAPEIDQRCIDERRRDWACGTDARDRLAQHVRDREITCRLKGADRYGRALGTCSAAGESLNVWMVREGWALAERQYSKAYIQDEVDARSHKRGLWRGAFVAPWAWGHRSQRTVVLGALSIPVDAQARLLAPVSAAGAPSPACNIKGNVNAHGERIYHQPGQMAYEHVNMNSGAGKRWFCTAQQAEAAGWRPARK